MKAITRIFEDNLKLATLGEVIEFLFQEGQIDNFDPQTKYIYTEWISLAHTKCSFPVVCVKHDSPRTAAKEKYLWKEQIKFWGTKYIPFRLVGRTTLLQGAMSPKLLTWLRPCTHPIYNEQTERKIMGEL